MSTQYTSVFERFALKLKDYELDALFVSSETNYNTYLKGFLLSAIARLTSECEQDLTDRNDTTMIFNIDLTEEELEILAIMMVNEWTGREYRKGENLRRTLGDGDFKLYSGANSLREIRETYNATREEIDNLIVNYGWASADFEDTDTW